MGTDMLKLVRRWLEEGREDAESIAEVPWMVEESGDGMSLVAVNPVFPVKLLAIHLREAGVIRLVVETGIRTADLDKDAKLSVYRKVLGLNTFPIAKIYLYGDDDELAVAADLSEKTLGENEFNDALSFLLAILGQLYRKVGIPEHVKQEMLANMAWLVYQWIQKGWSKEELQHLLERAGLPEQEAREIIASITEKPREKQEPSLYM